jgi:hypothetical protein
MTIALSSTEAEYVALSKVGREACWLRNFYEELGQKQQRPTLIKGDNDSSNNCYGKESSISQAIETHQHKVALGLEPHRREGN